MGLQPVALRDEFVAYLEANSFTTFGPTKFVDHTSIHQIWIRATAAPQRLARLIYDYGTGAAYVRFDEDTGPAEQIFYDELETLAAVWGAAVTRNTV